ncbi:unnamed protein product [Cutaneotrichosporon oleaginosum]
MTRRPRAAASCTPTCPSPPPEPEMTTQSPFSSSLSGFSAPTIVRPAHRSGAATSLASPSGIRETCVAAPTTYCASVPGTCFPVLVWLAQLFGLPFLQRLHAPHALCSHLIPTLAPSSSCPAGATTLPTPSCPTIALYGPQPRYARMSEWQHQHLRGQDSPHAGALELEQHLARTWGGDWRIVPDRHAGVGARVHDLGDGLRAWYFEHVSECVPPDARGEDEVAWLMRSAGPRWPDISVPAAPGGWISAGLEHFGETKDYPRRRTSSGGPASATTHRAQ